MPGHFFPAPPTFIGGRQPYAPKDGIAQSGPVPQAPPVRSYAAFVAIAVASLAAPPAFIGGDQPYAQQLGQVQSGPAVSQGPPPTSQVTLGVIRAAWSQEVVTVISMPSGAPFLADAGPPVPSSYVVRQAIRQAWDLPPYAIPRAATIAAVLAPPPVVSAPPITTLALLYETRAAWNPGPWPAQEGAQIAPLLPIAATPDAPPVRSYSGTIRQNWELAPLQPQQGARIAPLIPAAATPDQPPVPSKVTLAAIVDGWNRTLPVTQRPAQFVPVSIADQPPAQGYVVLRSIVESWNVASFVAQEQSQIAPLLSVPTVDAPPPLSYAALYSIRASWEPAPYRLPTGSKLAPFIPAPTPPSQPPVQTQHQLMSVIRQHDVAQWWPQPQFVSVSFSTQSAIYLAKQPGKIVRVKPAKRTDRLSSANRKTTGEQE